jgi:hypothetical protein
MERSKNSVRDDFITLQVNFHTNDSNATLSP